MKQNPKIIALAQAVGLSGYVTLVVFFLQNAKNLLNPSSVGETLVGMVMLLLFVISALISAAIMLGYPAILFFKGKRKTALKIILTSIGWLILIFALIIAIALLK